MNWFQCIPSLIYRSKHLHCVECFHGTHVQMKSVRYASLRSLLLLCRGNQKLTNWLAALYSTETKNDALVVRSLAKCVLCTSNQHEFSGKYFRKQFHTWSMIIAFRLFGCRRFLRHFRISLIKWKLTQTLKQTHSSSRSPSQRSQRDMFGERREDGCVKMKSV